MWEVALLALGNAAGPLLERAAKRHVEQFFGQALKDLAGIRKKKATTTAMVNAWSACVDLIGREIQYLGDFEDADPDFHAYFDALKSYVGQDVVGSELLRSLLGLDEQAPDPDVLRFGWAYLDGAPDLPDGFSWARIAKRYRKSLTRQQIFSDDLRQKLNAQNLEKIRQLLQGHTGVQPEADEARYAKRMREMYRVMDLSAMLPQTAEDRGLMRLRNAFVPQKVREDPPPVELPRDLLRQLKRDGSQAKDEHDEHTAEQIERLRESYSQRPAEPVLEVVAEGANRLVLIGGPGSGKSTLTRYLLLTGLDGLPGGRPPAERPPVLRPLAGHLPLLVELREYIAVYADKRADDFLSYWHHLGREQKIHLDQSWLHDRLASAPTLVLFDGLDEIFDARDRERVMHAIVGFAGQYPQARVVVTSRPVGYRDAILRAGDFKHYAIEDLDDEQIELFVNGWFGHLFPDQPKEAEQRRQRILSATAKSRPVRLLAGNPMLLTIMALIAQLRELPRERWRFYDHAAEVLCHHWDVNRHLEAEGIDEFIGLEDKKELLERIAKRMQQGEGGLAGNVLRRQDLHAEVESYLAGRYGLDRAQTKPVAKQLIAQLRGRNYVLCLRGPKLYGFVHRTFLEYFSATGLVRRLQDDPEYSIETLRDDVFGRHWREESWREVLRLIAGMVGERQVAVLIRYLAREANPDWWVDLEINPPGNLALGIECLAEVRNLHSLQGEVTDLLQVILDVVDLPSEWGGEALNRLLADRLIPAAEEIRLPEAVEGWFTERSYRQLQELTSVFLIAPMAKMATLWISTWQVILARASEENHSARSAALQVLARRFKDHPSTRQLLATRAVEDHNQDPRSAALKELAREFKKHPDTRTILADRAVTDEHFNPRSIALQELARGFKKHPDTKKLVAERAIEDDNEDLRSTALRELARGFKELSGTRAILADRAIQDDHFGPRVTALQELARGFKKHPDTRTILADRAIQDDHFSPRVTALQELARGFKKHPDTRTILAEGATEGDHFILRRTALQELTREFKEHPDTKRILADRATQDNHPSLRRTALQELARGFKEHPDTRKILANRAIQDDHFNPRSAALQELAQGFKEHPDTRKILVDRATRDDHEYPRRTALHELARGFKEHPDTRTVLADRATQDDHEYPRSVALHELARGFKEHPDTRTILADMAIQDDHEYTRGWALKELARWLLDRRASVFLSKDLDGADPFLDPLKPIPDRHLRRGAKKLGLSIEQARDLLAACEPILGWNPLGPPKPHST